MLSQQQEVAWFGPGTDFQQCKDCLDVFSAVWPVEDIFVHHHDQPWDKNDPVWQCFDCFALVRNGITPYPGMVSYLPEEG